MPDKAKSHHKKRRIRPVIEEIVENTPTVVESAAPSYVETPSIPEPVAEIQTEVARYDEPPTIPGAPSAPIQTLAPSEFLDEPKKSLDMRLLFGLTVVISLIVGFVTGGVYMYLTAGGQDGLEVVVASPAPTSTPEASPTPSVSPSPTSSTKPSSYKVSVLNGSGVIGAASKVKEALESGGFVVSATGNADRYTYANTTIRAKEGVPLSSIELVKAALSDGYTVEVGSTLEDSSSFDIVVIAGRR
jgi:LysM repeat protein